MMVADITTEELDEMIEDHEHLLIVDVREPQEYRDRHIPGALNQPLGLTGAVPDAMRGRTLVLYSNRGRRSAAAAARLRELGVEPVYSLNGGLSGWQAAGMAVVSG